MAGYYSRKSFCMGKTGKLVQVAGHAFELGHEVQMFGVLGDIDFIINTPGSHDARADDIIIRSSAIAAKTSYCTNLASAQACVNAIEALKNKNLQVCTIQEYHAQNL